MKQLFSLRTLRLSTMSSLFALVGLLLLAVGTPTYAASKSTASVIPNAGAPITKIVRTKHGLAFNPNSIQIFLAHTSAIEVDNNTNHTRTVLDSNDTIVLTLAPGASGFLTFTQTGTFVYHLSKHPHVTFTAIVS